MEKREREDLALLVFPQKLGEMEMDRALSINVGTVSSKIKVPYDDVEIFFKVAIAKMVRRKAGLSVKIPEIDPRLEGEIAYKLLCSYARGNGIRLSENIRREVGSWSAKSGISTEKGMEFLAEIVKDAFFSKNAD